MDPAMIIAAIEAGTEVISYVKGVIDRHNAGTAITEDEAGALLAAKQLLAGAKADADAADAEMAAEIKGVGGVGGPAQQI